MRCMFFHFNKRARVCVCVFVFAHCTGGHRTNNRNKPSFSLLSHSLQHRSKWQKIEKHKSKASRISYIDLNNDKNKINQPTPNISLAAKPLRIGCCDAFNSENNLRYLYADSIHFATIDLAEPFSLSHSLIVCSTCIVLFGRSFVCICIRCLIWLQIDSCIECLRSVQ